MEKEFLQQFLGKIELGELDTLNKFLQAINGGNNKIVHNLVQEAVRLDDGWVTELESGLYYVEDIVKNPKKFLIDEDVVVEVERARRTNAKTIRHLASNTKNINNIDSAGEVMPKKVLTTQINEELAIYENRFVCTLVNRLVNFVEKHDADIKEKLRVFDVTHIKWDSSFKYGETAFDYRLIIDVKEPPSDKKLVEANNALIKRIENIRRRLKALKNTQFIKTLSATKPIVPPIVKTNIIRMNLNYQSCYKLWLFISSYSAVGYSVEVMDKNLPVDSHYFDDMTMLEALSVKSLLDNEIVRKKIYEGINFSAPKVKKYKVSDKLDYKPDFSSYKKAAGEDAVNEYFFEQMKNVLYKKTGVGTTSKADDRQVRLAFERFVKTVARINTAMYTQAIKDGLPQPRKGAKRRTPLMVKEDEYKRQQAVYKRYRQLAKLKSDEMEKALNAQSKELVKLEKIKFELDKLNEKAVAKKQAEKNKRERLKKIKAQAKKVREKASEYETELMEQETDRRLKVAQAEEEKRRKRSEARTAAKKGESKG